MIPDRAVPYHLRGMWRSPLLAFLVLGPGHPQRALNEEFMWQEWLDGDKKPTRHIGHMSVTSEEAALRCLLARKSMGEIVAPRGAMSFLLCGKSLLRKLHKDRLRYIEASRTRFGFDIFELQIKDTTRVYLAYEPHLIHADRALLFNTSFVRLRHFGGRVPLPQYGSIDTVGIQVMAPTYLVTIDDILSWLRAFGEASVPKDEPPSSASPERQAAAREIDGWIRTLVRLPEPVEMIEANQAAMRQRNMDARIALQNIRRLLLWGQ